MSIIIKKENGKFNMYQNGTLTHENLKVVFDKRKGEGEGDIRLPENPFDKKWLSTTAFKDRDEIDLANLPKRQPSDPNRPKTTVSEPWTNYLTEEEKKVYDDLKTKCETRMAQKKAETTITTLFEGLTEDQKKAILLALSK